ncbi:MAG: IS1595 family transposase [Dehalococcoidia bacterium]
MTEPKTFLEILQWSPAQARKYLESVRWPDGPVCPNGCAAEVYRFEARTRRKTANGETKVQPTRHLLKCSSCKRQFSATVGMIFEDSKVPLNKWLAAIYLMCASKKGMSAHQLHRMLGVTYKTAWFMCHRVRHAMSDKNGAPLSGIIEADETYVGGRPRGHPKHRSGRSQREIQRQSYNAKTPVFGILERGGRVRAVAMPGVSKTKIEQAFADNVDFDSSVLVTDESPLYGDIKTLLPHRTVKHSEEYVTGDGIHTQGIENFWSLLKRGLHGTFHHVRPAYLGMYADEFAFRYNAREMNDGERFASALEQAQGRLTWYVGRASQGPSQPAS